MIINFNFESQGEGSDYERKDSNNTLRIVICLVIILTKTEQIQENYYQQAVKSPYLFYFLLMLI